MLLKPQEEDLSQGTKRRGGRGRKRDREGEKERESNNVRRGFILLEWSERAEEASLKAIKNKGGREREKRRDRNIKVSAREGTVIQMERGCERERESERDKKKN